MNFVTVGRENSCDIQLYYKDWGAGETVLFCHGWPLNSDVWERQMLALNEEGYRTIAFDRRGFGSSTKTSDGYHMDQFADDLATFIDTLVLDKVTLVAHSMGCGEVVRYLARHGEHRVNKLVLIGSVTPMILRSESNPNGAELSFFDQLRAGILTDRYQFFHEVSSAYFGELANGEAPSSSLKEAYCAQGRKACLKAILDCTYAFSETDFFEDLTSITVPTLLIHSEKDQMVPFELTSKKTHQIIEHSILKVYQDGSHGLAQTHANQLNQDLIEFIKHEAL
jgi:non-heme chloroperoxidase